MKRVRIQTGFVGIVTKNQEYRRALTKGAYLLGFGENVELFDVNKAFVHENLELHILLEDKQLADMLHVVDVKAFEVVMVYKDGVFSQVLEHGKYAYWKSHIQYQFKVLGKGLIERCDTEQELLFKTGALDEYAEILSVADHELALVYINGHFSHSLTAGFYVYWKGYVDFQFTLCDLSKIDITEEVNFSAVKKVGTIQHIRTVKVESFEKAVLFANGNQHAVLSSGLYHYWKNEIELEVRRADMRLRQLEVSGQEILTKDKAAVRINYDAQYQVIDVEKALLNSKDYEKQLYMAVQLALREYVGMFTLDELLEKKESAAEYIGAALTTRAAQLGVKVTDSGIRDIILNGDMKDIMNQVLIAQKRAQANTISRREETASTRSLLNTAKLMEDNAMLFKLKEMEYVEKIADKINNITVSGGNQVAEQLRMLFGTSE